MVNIVTKVIGQTNLTHKEGFEPVWVSLKMESSIWDPTTPPTRMTPLHVGSSTRDAKMTPDFNVGPIIRIIRA